MMLFIGQPIKSLQQKAIEKKTPFPLAAVYRNVTQLWGFRMHQALMRLKRHGRISAKKHHPDLFSGDTSMQAKGDEILKKATSAYKEIEAFLKLHKKI